MKATLQINFFCHNFSIKIVINIFSIVLFTLTATKSPARRKRREEAPGGSVISPGGIGGSDTNQGNLKSNPEKNDFFYLHKMIRYKSKSDFF